MAEFAEWGECPVCGADLVQRKSDHLWVCDNRSTCGRIYRALFNGDNFLGYIATVDDGQFYPAAPTEDRVLLDACRLIVRALEAEDPDEWVDDAVNFLNGPGATMYEAITKEMADAPPEVKGE